ncbi:MAG: hypothetical protein WCJ09_06255 [Planctomycetota bacterium]
MASPYLTLQPSEQVLISAAATIYAGYLATGKVAEGEENHWMDQAIKAAFRIATVVDASIVADKEMG